MFLQGPVNALVMNRINFCNPSTPLTIPLDHKIPKIRYKNEYCCYYY